MGKEVSPHPDPEAHEALSLPPDSTMRRPLTTRGCNCSSTKLTFLLTEVSLSELLEDERTDAKVRGGTDGRDEGREEMSKEDGEQS